MNTAGGVSASAAGQKKVKDESRKSGERASQAELKGAHSPVRVCLSVRCHGVCRRARGRLEIQINFIDGG
jgi:hypothetical protein